MDSRERLIPYGSERAFRNGVFGTGFFSACFYLLSSSIHLFSILRRTKVYALFDHQDTVFYGHVHGFTFDVKSASKRLDFYVGWDEVYQHGTKDGGSKI
jgi:hypothetical protein